MEMRGKNVTDCEQIVVNGIAKWNKVNFYSVISAVAFFFAALIELSFINFFTPEFTAIFLAVSGSLTLAACVCLIISRRKLKNLENRLLKLKSEKDER